MARELRLPGAKAGVLCVWLILLAPFGLLLSGAAMFGLGLAVSSDTAIAFGAAAWIAGLLLPRMSGSFEIGMRGIRGNLKDEVIEETIRKGFERGLSGEQVAELVTEDVGIGYDDAFVTVDPSVGSGALIREAAWSLAEDRVSRAVALQAAIRAILDRFASHYLFTLEETPQIQVEDPGLTFSFRGDRPVFWSRAMQRRVVIRSCSGSFPL